MTVTRFTVTLTYSYDKTDEELTEFYGTVNTAEAAEIDQNNFREDPGFILEDLSWSERNPYITVTGEKVSDGEL